MNLEVILFHQVINGVYIRDLIYHGKWNVEVKYLITF